MINCLYCAGEIPAGTFFIGMGNGHIAHERCYYLNHAYKPKYIFQEVLANSDDQVLVRELLNHYIPDHVKVQIIGHFNYEMRRRWAECIR